MPSWRRTGRTRRAVSAEQALDILADDVRRGWLDGDLLRVFVEAKIYDDPEFRALLPPKA